MEPNPATCSLHLPNSTPNTHTPQPLNYEALIDPDAASLAKLGQVTEETDSSKYICEAARQERAVSTEFLLDGRHKLEFGFPWERPRPAFEDTGFVENQPTTTEEAQGQLVSPTEEASQSGLEAVERRECEGRSQEQPPTASPVRAALRRGISLGVTRNRSKETVVQIAMDDSGAGAGGEEGEEEGMDERKRRELATEKWRERRKQMDVELKRLRHNEERARRFSGAFVHQALDPRDQEQHHRRTQSSRAGSAGNKTHWKQSRTERMNRSRSVQVDGAAVWQKLEDHLVPHLEITEEEEEEEEAGLGLPPKDVPFYEDKMTGVALDMSQIPVAEIAESVHSQSSADHSWNTGGGQEDLF